MKTGADVDAGPLVFTLVLLVFFHFLGATIGGPLSGIAVFFTLLFLFDITQVFWTNQRLRQTERFSSDHPVKGETLTYTHYLETGPWLFRSCRLDLEYRFPKVDESSYVEKQTKWMPGKARTELSVACGFRHRGAYAVGLRDFVLRSWSGWLRFRIPVWEKMFYVRPRVVELKRFPFLAARDGVESHQYFHLLNADPAVFERVDPYREGMSLKGVDFRPLARGLPPVVRIFLPEPWARIRIFLDLYRSRSTNPDTDDAVLDREDIVIEAAASLSRFLVQNGLPVDLISSGQDRSVWEARSLADCEAWEIASVQFHFQEVPSLADVWRERESAGDVSGVFICARPDPLLWDFLENTTGPRRLIQVLKDWPESDLESWNQRREFLARAGVETLELRETDDMLHSGGFHAV